MTKYIDVATHNAVTTSLGWNARLEVAKLILIDREGKSRSKSRIFSWLSEMITYNGKKLFVPFILLGKHLLKKHFKLNYMTQTLLFSSVAKCHDEEICAGCNKASATQYYENGLLQQSNNKALEIYARMRLVEIYYKSHADTLLKEQLKLVEPLVNSLTDASEKKSKSADLYYYQGKNSCNSTKLRMH